MRRQASIPLFGEIAGERCLCEILSG